MNRSRSIRELVLLTTLLVGPALSAQAGIHTWDVNEVFSNGDGTIQFVELWEANGTPGETGVGNATVSTNTNTFVMSEGAVAPPTTNKFFLLGTAAFAALPGAPTPDAIIPAGMVPFFNTAGDTVAYLGFDSWVFGAVPTNGTDSLDRITGVGVNSPTNYAGTMGSVDASGPPSVPSASGLALLLGLAALMTAGIAFLARGRSAA